MIEGADEGSGQHGRHLSYKPGKGVVLPTLKPRADTNRWALFDRVRTPLSDGHPDGQKDSDTFRCFAPRGTTSQGHPQPTRLLMLTATTADKHQEASRRRLDQRASSR
ncbi:hypothetical protein A605_14562 (plasmid) [Corynebacterium halotolerans YIM 70093 = DSM 44683]|uniref:Uncharacterized protein n=1 Tax=Corynebacterium halotolerans YIM 70093 = DSM 44683 TaxID=1121362 RepID=M1NWL9_9CORY|nr:hypothetical protein A605_14562 [Corynebacterium halotolerans YIM 70093 = DSM 44683]